MTRLNTIDSAKTVMIYLVVLGHFIEPLISASEVYKQIYKSIYLFHMPVFIMVSGMLTKYSNRDNCDSKTLFMLLVFLFFNFLYEVYYWFLFKKISSYYMNFQPHWILWYIFSLFVWRVLAPVFIKFRYPITLSFAVSLFAGCFDSVGYFFGLSRTIYFFPFFLIGHLKINQENLLRYKNKCMLLILFFVILILYLFFTKNISPNWLYGSLSYKFFLFDEYVGVGFRLITYITSYILSVILLGVFLTSHSSFVSGLFGASSLYIYLWHGLVIKTLMANFFFVFLKRIPIWQSLSILALLSIFVCYVLSNKNIRKLTDCYILHPLKNLTHSHHA